MTTHIIKVIQFYHVMYNWRFKCIRTNEVFGDKNKLTMKIIISLSLFIIGIAQRIIFKLR